MHLSMWQCKSIAGACSKEQDQQGNRIISVPNAGKQNNNNYQQIKKSSGLEAVLRLGSNFTARDRALIAA